MIFAATGGVMEAAVRTAYYLVTGERPPEQFLTFKAIRGLQGVKESTVDIPGLGALNVAVCNGLKNARILLDKLRTGDKTWGFIEVMACQGGCIGGGGQPRTSLPPSDTVRIARISSIYSLDNTTRKKRLSFENKDVQLVYKSFLTQPLGEMSEHLLHTHYKDRSSQLIAKTKYSLDEGESNG